jgi:serine/threonine protein kinase
VLRSCDRLVPGRGAPPLNADGSLHESPPAAFGPFRVLHQVGAGSLGPVFRAHDSVEGRLVAIKAFRLDVTPEQAAEFAVELEDLAANQPRHPGMAAALAAGVQGTTPYLAPEYVAGEALDAALRQFGPPPSAEALTTLRRVAEALDRAAGDGIHHGTLHPRDILIAEGGEARVIDLGVAQALARSGLRVPVRRPYSAPERVNEQDWNGAADIYALGAIAFELLTGRRLSGSGRPELETVAPAQAAGPLGDVLARALDADPQRRYPSATDLVEALAPHLPKGRRASRHRPSADVPLPLDPFEDMPPPVPLEEFPSESTPAATDGAESQTSEPPVFPGPVSPEPDSGVSDAVASEPVRDEATDDAGRFAQPADPSPRFLTLDDESEGEAYEAQARPSFEFAPAASPTPPLTLDDETPVAGWAPAAAAPPPLDRRPILPLAIALLVGVAAGFGWGYWTAFRTLDRPAAQSADASQPIGQASPDSEPVVVEDPEVIGERGLPPPDATPQAPPQAERPAPDAASRQAAPAPSPRPATPPQAAPPTPAGRLLVRSTPSGARVRVDGQVRGRTPLALRDLPLRVLRVRVEQDGYQADERRVALSARQPSVTVESRLAAVAPPPPTATAGALLVESRPTGATVFVDGRRIGATPLSLPDVAPGTRRIRLELAGFTPWVTTAAVQAGERTRVAASLERGAQE